MDGALTTAEATEAEGKPTKEMVRHLDASWYLVRRLNAGAAAATVRCRNPSVSVSAICQILTTTFTPPITFSRSLDSEAHVAVACVTDNEVEFALQSNGAVFCQAPKVRLGSCSFRDVQWAERLENVTCGHALLPRTWSRASFPCVEFVDGSGLDMTVESVQEQWRQQFDMHHLSEMFRATTSGVLFAGVVEGVGTPVQGNVGIEAGWCEETADALSTYLSTFFPPFHPDSTFTMTRYRFDDQSDVVGIAFTFPEDDCASCRTVRAHPEDIGTASLALDVRDFWLRSFSSLDCRVRARLEDPLHAKVLLGPFT